MGFCFGIQYLSIMQAVDVWSELEQAYYGDARYGGSTAEIYAYRLLPANPLQGFHSQVAEETEIKRGMIAAEALIELCCLFMEKRDCRILIDGKKINSDLSGYSLSHRAHVKVVHNDESDVTP